MRLLLLLFLSVTAGCATAAAAPGAFPSGAALAAAAAAGASFAPAADAQPQAAAPAPGPDVLAELFRAARRRLFGGDATAAGTAGGPCTEGTAAQGDGRPNFFLAWPLHASQFGQLAFAVVEAILFHHPGANVVVASLGLQEDLFDAYLREGYCVVSLPIDAPRAERLLLAAVDPSAPVPAQAEAGRGGGVGEQLSAGEQLVGGFLQTMQSMADEAHLLFFLNCVLLAMQVVYGGISLPMEGLLLNPFDFQLPRQLELQRTAMILERLLPAEEPPHEGALQAEDFEQSWLPRAHTDRADGRTVLCMDLPCPRALPAGSSFGQLVLEGWLHGALERASGGALPELDAMPTALYRMYVRQRPKAAPFEVDGFVFNHETALLPHWLITEPQFPDGWKSFGGQDSSPAGAPSAHSQLFAPRAKREPVDWALVSTAKLWLPLGYGPPSARNIMPRSVVDMALRHFALGLSPRPFRKKALGRPSGPDPSARRLQTPQLAQADFDLEESLRQKGEGALPGDIGGFRTFRQLRLVGREPPEQRRSALDGWRITVSARVAGARTPRLYCRRENRPTPSIPPDGTGAAHGSSASTSAQRQSSAALRKCEAALQFASASSPGAAGEEPGGGGWTVQFDACGSPSELNAALALLAYRPVAGLGKAPGAGDADIGATPLDQRLDEEELQSHFGELKVFAFPHCSAAKASHSVEMAALLDDVEDHVTIVAHCAERCHLLDRLAETFRGIYKRIQIGVTCECSEEEPCPEPVARPHASIPGMTVVSVPYDFGLSRGKTLLTRMASTEFVLVLDDDFTHSFHSCLECMLWRMRSHHHSLWRPFDIVGFPVLEDERIFGAFRGQLRATNRQLFLEPMVEQTTADGCVRVDICPMVFLARTARLRKFKFQEDLRVGEHEKFFYSNAYFGLQVAVCFDSSFPHFRVNTMSAGYVKRRERMPELMLSAFRNLGFERAMFLFRKYDHGSMPDYDELLEKAVPPWYIADDSCGPRTAPPVPFAQIFALIFSSADAEGQRYRAVLRGQTDATAVWLQRFVDLDPGNLRWAFVVAADGAQAGEVLREQEQHKDVVLVPSASASGGGGGGGPTFEQLLRALSLLRDVHFRWLIVAQQDMFVHTERLVNSLQAQEPPEGKVLGAWRQARAGGAGLGGAAPLASLASPTAAGLAGAAAGGAVAGKLEEWLDTRFFAVSRDVFALLTSPILGPLLQAARAGTGAGDLGSLSGGLNAWLRALAVSRAPLDGARLDEPLSSPFGAPAGAARPCPAGTSVLHPVTPEQLYALSHSPASAAC